MNANSMIFADAAAAPSATAAAPSAAAPAAPANATTATTQQPADAKPAPQPGLLDGLGGMVPFILIIVVMFYLMYRGQKKEQKKRQEMLESIKKDDPVITIGGIYGIVTEIKDDRFKIKIAAGTEIEVSKTAVGNVIKPGTEDAKK